MLVPETSADREMDIEYRYAIANKEIKDKFDYGNRIMKINRGEFPKPTKENEKPQLP